jgi:hypothetical protein
VKANSIAAIKRAEARDRMTDMRRSRKNRSAALAIQRRNVLVDGSKGTITNLRRVVHAMAKWAEPA